MRAKYIYWLCAMALIGMNIWSLVVVQRLYRLQQIQPPAADLSSISKIREITLKDGSEPLKDIGAHNRAVLLVMFSPYDCMAALGELEELEALHKEQPSLDIRAVALYESGEEVNQLQSQMGLTYPIYSDPDARVKAVLHPPLTPWKLMLNADDMAVYLEDGPSITQEEKTAFHTRASNLENGWLINHASKQ